jgi:hypothetical protein
MDGEVTLARLVTWSVHFCLEFMYNLLQISSIVSKLIPNALKTP